MANFKREKKTRTIKRGKSVNRLKILATTGPMAMSRGYFVDKDASWAS